MLKKIVFGALSLSFLFAGLGGCAYDNVGDLPMEVPCDPNATVSYSADIVPIMSVSCSSSDASCHGPGNFNNALLNDYAGVKVEVDNGKLISSITWDGVATLSRMPSGSSTKIDDCSIGKIERWIAAGAPNN
ncbi:MAG: hypothetical protein GC192_14650 [Bacteroidetes bacterium]|nr:hypothetical protein [Bacteroidota bacterium]